MALFKRNSNTMGEFRMPAIRFGGTRPAEAPVVAPSAAPITPVASSPVQPYTEQYYDQQYSPEAIFARKSGKPMPARNQGYTASPQATAYANYHKGRGSKLI